MSAWPFGGENAAERLDLAAPRLDLSLPRGETLTLAARAGLVVRCDSGCLWITAAHCSEDWVLLPGQQWQALGGGEACIQACRASRLQLGRPERLRMEAPGGAVMSGAAA